MIRLVATFLAVIITLQAQITQIPASSSGGGGTWGSITGVLSSQSDLNTALGLKVPTATAINTTAPLAGGGDLSANRTLTCIAATGSVAGCLSAADWTTFNAKQVAGSYITALSGNVVASGPGSSVATIQAGVVTSAMLAGSIDPAKIIGGTFGAGNYVYPGNVMIGTRFLGDSSTWQYNPALSTPGTPGAAGQGMAGAVNYCYKISAVPYSGAPMTSLASTVAGCNATGNATQDGSNFTRITWSAVTGAACYNVYRTTAPDNIGDGSDATGMISQCLNALTIDDTGIIPVALIGTSFDFGGIDIPSVGSSAGQYISKTIYGNQLLASKASFGNQAGINSTLQGFNSPSVVSLLDVTTPAASDSYTGATSGLLVYATNHPNIVTGRGEAIDVSGTGTIDYLLGNSTDMYIDGNVSVTNYARSANFNATSVSSSTIPELTGLQVGARNLGSGTPALMYGIKSSITGGATAAYAFWSDAAAASGHWFVYGSSTAKSHFGGDVEVPSLTFNGHACSLVANVVTCP